MIAFVHINKTAGTTLKHILRQSFGGQHCDTKVWPSQDKAAREANYLVLTAADIEKSQTIYRNLESIAGHLVTNYSDLHTIPGLRFYTFLREPIKRTASHYQFMKNGPGTMESFEEWISNPFYRNVQTRKICGEENAEKAIDQIKNFGFVGLQERFDESLLLLKKWVDQPSFDVHYQSRNVAKSKKMADKLLQEPRSLDLFKEGNLEDIKLYEFVKNELFPKQLKNYGERLNEDLLRLKEENKSFNFQERLGSRINRKLYKLALPLISRGKAI